MRVTDRAPATVAPGPGGHGHPPAPGRTGPGRTPGPARRASGQPGPAAPGRGVADSGRTPVPPGRAHAAPVPGAVGPVPIAGERARPTDDELRRAAIAVLRANDRGVMTVAAPALYPHMWSWDAAFVAIGLARFDVPRAVTELRTLLGAQWSTGMIPHIRYTPGATGYFPDAARWGATPAAPPGVATSGICQPPVHAIALRHVLDRGREHGGRAEEVAEAFARTAFDRLLAWHRWLATARDPEGVGLVEIHHGWESGLDNSPRWDAPYARVAPGRLPPYVRRDTAHVGDAAERPTDAEYDRYLWLVEQLRSVRYDDEAAGAVVDFRVRDVLFSAILAAASEVLAGIGAELGRDRPVEELLGMADRFRAGVAATVDPATGLARDHDVRAQEWVATETVAGFAPLIAGGDPALLAEQALLLRGERWTGFPGLAHPLPPSTSPASPAFRPRTYWRGPVWPFLNLLFGWAATRDGDLALAKQLRTASLDQLGDLTFAEYYDPFTGAPLGSRHQSWTAAAALEWLGTT